MGEVMIIRFNCMTVRNDLGIARLKEIGPKICVEYLTLKQSHVIKNISALVVRVANWKHDARQNAATFFFLHSYSIFSEQVVEHGSSYEVSI